jgi:hypothetical protein
LILLLLSPFQILAAGLRFELSRAPCAVRCCLAGCVRRRSGRSCSVQWAMDDSGSSGEPVVDAEAFRRERRERLGRVAAGEGGVMTQTQQQQQPEQQQQPPGGGGWRTRLADKTRQLASSLDAAMEGAEGGGSLTPHGVGGSMGADSLRDWMAEAEGGAGVPPLLDGEQVESGLKAASRLARGALGKARGKCGD